MFSFVFKSLPTNNFNFEKHSLSNSLFLIFLSFLFKNLEKNLLYKKFEKIKLEKT